MGRCADMITYQLADFGCDGDFVRLWTEQLLGGHLWVSFPSLDIIVVFILNITVKVVLTRENFQIIQLILVSVKFRHEIARSPAFEITQRSILVSDELGLGLFRAHLHFLAESVLVPGRGARLPASLLFIFRWHTFAHECVCVYVSAILFIYRYFW